MLDEQIKECIQDNLSEIFERSYVSFMNLRKEVLKLELEKQYEYLFIKPYEGITFDELNILDDVDREIKIMSKNKPVATLDEIVKHYNKRYYDAKKSAQIINYIYDMCTPSEFENYFYELDMDNIRFRTLSKQNKEKIIEKIKKIGMLSSITDILRFMKFTKYLVAELEGTISTALRSSDIYEKEYVEIINSVDSITPKTIENILAFRYVYVYSDKINEILLDRKMYRKYLYSITIKRKLFTMPRIEELVESAEEIFKENKWKTMIGYMCNNNEFMDEMIARKVYDFTEAIRKHFVICNQNVDMIKNLFEKCSNDEIKSYLCKIKGFKDYDAAKEFVILVEQTPEVLFSQEVYEHTYHMLLDKTLKKRYTKKRNQLVKNKSI